MFNFLKPLRIRWRDFWFRLGEVGHYTVNYEVVTSIDKETGEETDCLLFRIKFKLFGFIPMWLPLFDEDIEKLHNYEQHEDELLKQCLAENYGTDKHCSKQF